jgi:hypothetical protein
VNRSKFLPRGRAAVCRLTLPMLLAVPMVMGCGSSSAPVMEGRVAIENVAKWRQLYTAEHGGKPPADEQTFLAFIEKKLTERGEAFNPNELLTSPRDGQRFVVQYGDQSPKLGENRVTVHEQQGYDGKVLVAFESGRSQEVDSAELPNLLAEEPSS